MSPERELLVFWLDGQRHGVPLERVGRVVHAVAVTPLPGAPDAVLGAIDLAGGILPVFSLRRRLGLPERPLQLDDEFLVVDTGRRRVALVVDRVQGLTPVRGEFAGPEALGLVTGVFQGMARLDDGLLLIHDLERFLSPQDERAVDAAMAAAA